MKEKIKYAGAMLICFIAVLFIRMPVMADDGVPETAWRDNAAADFAGGRTREPDMMSGSLLVYRIYSSGFTRAMCSSSSWAWALSTASWGPVPRCSWVWAEARFCSSMGWLPSRAVSIWP